MSGLSTSFCDAVGCYVSTSGQSVHRDETFAERMTGASGPSRTATTTLDRTRFTNAFTNVSCLAPVSSLPCGATGYWRPRDR